MEANLTVILISLALFLAYLSGIIYTRTGVPDLLWLIGFGVILRPVLDVIGTGQLSLNTPLLVVMVLSLIMFEAGLSVDLNTFKETMGKSGWLALTTFTVSTLMVGSALRLALPGLFSLPQALLFGSMTAGTGTSTVLSVLGNMQRTSPTVSEARSTLVLESIITDSLSIVTSMSLIRVIQTPGLPLSEGLRDVLYVFTMSMIIGFTMGVLWVRFLDIARNRPFNYIMTIAVLFIAYTVGEGVGGPGSGAIVSMVFGLTMTNYPLLAKRYKMRENVRVDKRKLRALHEEMTFLLKSILFLYIGLELSIIRVTLLWGLGVTALLGLSRVVSVGLTDMIAPLPGVTVSVSRLVFCNGLTALVISQLPLMVVQPGFFTDPYIYQNLLVPVIFASCIFSSLMGPFLLRRGLKKSSVDEA